jgi:hypothetical protein
MDPLTALSLAGNIIQFVEFGTRLLSTTKELYRSSKGTLNINDELQLVTTDFSTLITILKNSSASQGDGSSNFDKICDEALAVATEIITKLEDLKLDEGKFKLWRSLQRAVKEIWSERELKGLVDRLNKLRKALDATVLFSLRLEACLVHVPGMRLTIIAKILMLNPSGCRRGSTALIARRSESCLQFSKPRTPSLQICPVNFTKEWPH